ncbi:Phage tail sheath protein FI [Arsukibacterium tuosuense]|uniref:Phage tail sheath protein FI n=1 Tax=Arsukibacterium tuosuense TaxID=1323745 RepID=A0A285IWR3_9GAMM|nr:phage tail sheath C-terminal domain-containing protein [Arsukibacterium tuosuense]SNY52263.1 Phage tail sheath protein FI [Arsukibacterium tuosuense]
MANYLQPGVYVNETPVVVKSVTAAATTRVAFIGSADSGPLAKPVLIASFADYQQQFQDPEQDAATIPDPMTQAVMAFFGNGGKSAYICRVTDNNYQAFYQDVLCNYRDFSLIVLPGQYWGNTTSKAAIMATLTFCQQVRHCMVLLDMAPGQQLHSKASVNATKLPTSSYAAVYYPWLMMANPLHHATTNPAAPKTLLIAPSAVAAAVFVKTDNKYGVWKAPAGVSAKIAGVSGLEFNVDDDSQQQLNPLGINCIRTLPRLGTVVWGARTLASQTDPEWRYISVRRTAIFLEQSIIQSLQWAVFEPNDRPLWQTVRLNISNFLVTLFRAGAMQGTTQKEAFFVRCGLHETMNQQDLDQQQLVIELGFAPVKPAEFVVLRIIYKLNPP